MAGQFSVDAIEFRNALGSFATGVTIVTARDAAGHPVGVTASSFNSVSLNPPMVLWSLAKTARSFEVFQSASHWAVHVLAADQDALSNRFAKSGEDKFAGLETEVGVGQIPLLKDCATCFQCRTVFKYEGGDHIIFVGEVETYTYNDKPPLVFHSGKYALAARMTAPTLLSHDVSRESGATQGDDFIGYLLWRANFHFHEKVAAYMRAEKLDQDSFMILARLLHHDGCAPARLCSGMPWADAAQVQLRLVELQSRGLVRIDAGDACVWLTDAGREGVLRIDAASKAIEADLLGRMKAGEALAFKHMLRRFIVDTDAGLPHPWEDGTA